MKTKWWMMMLVLFSVLALAVGCGDDDDDEPGGDTDQVVSDEDNTSGGDEDVTAGDEDEVTEEATEEEAEEQGEPLQCSDPLITDSSLYGVKETDCDTIVGVCENALTDGAAFFPCVDDPDCCCNPDGTSIDLGDGLTGYPCENDSCTQDGYCDSTCPDGEDADCQ